MVAVKSHEADRFLLREFGNFAVFLVFGTDAGLVSERARALLKTLVDDPADPFQLVRLGGDEAARDPLRLVDEAGTMPLFGGRRAVHVDAGTKNVAAAVEPLLTGPRLAPVVVEAAGLKKDAPLRKLVERARTGAAVECVPDEERDVLRLIDSDVAAAGLTIAPQAREALAALLGADRLASRSELAKLTLFARGADAITLDHVEASVADASVLAVDALIDAVFTGNVKAFDDMARKAIVNQVEAGQVLSAALRHATWLHRAKTDLQSGGTLDAVLAQGARYGIGYKRKAAVEHQLTRATVDQLFRNLVRLGEAIGHVRRHPDLAESLAVRALWSVALSVRKA